MIIYLGLPLPAASSDPPESRPGRPVAFCLVLLRMGFAYAPAVTSRAVVSYTALPTLPCKMRGGIFLLHFPWSRLHRTLSGILPCEARTFLTCSGYSRKQPRSFILLGILSTWYFIYLVFYLLGILVLLSFLKDPQRKCSRMKYASADKFPAYGVIRHAFAADTDKILQKLQESFGFMVLRLLFADLEEQGFRILL